MKMDEVFSHTFKAMRKLTEEHKAAGDVFGHPVTVSSLLEQHATPAQKAAKIDLVDYLFRK